MGVCHFYHLAHIHHRHPVADMGYYAHIMRLKQIGQTQVMLEILQQIQDLRLDRNVQGRDRFIAHQEPGAWRQRARQANPLALATAEGMRIAAHILRPQPNQLQDFRHPVFQFFALRQIHGAQWGANNLEQSHPRV